MTADVKYDLAAGLTPDVVIRRLGQIERELAKIQNAWETAAEHHARLDRQWKRREHACLRSAKGPSEAVKKANAFIEACEKDDLYEKLTAAEEGLAKARTLYTVLDRRASIGQSILKAMTSEQFRSGPQPQWSGRVAA